MGTPSPPVTDSTARRFKSKLGLEDTVSSTDEGMSQDTVWGYPTSPPVVLFSNQFQKDIAEIAGLLDLADTGYLHRRL